LLEEKWRRSVAHFVKGMVCEPSALERPLIGPALDAGAIQAAAQLVTACEVVIFQHIGDCQALGGLASTVRPERLQANLGRMREIAEVDREFSIMVDSDELDLVRLIGRRHVYVCGYSAAVLLASGRVNQKVEP
jgi:hypothetical protein